MKITIELTRATDTTEETWVSHCLEIDCVSQGPAPHRAIELLAEAIDMMVRDEMSSDPRPEWEQAFANIAAEVAARDQQKGREPGPSDEEMAALIDAALKDPTRRFVKREEIGPWLESIRAEEVDPGVFVIESTDDDDDRPF